MDQNLNGTAATISDYKDVTNHYNNANAQGAVEPAPADANRRKEIQFKAQHILTIGFFLWVLYVGD